MSDAPDPDAALKAELCTQLASVIYEQVPGYWPSADVIRDQLLADLHRELLWDQPGFAKLREAQDELLTLIPVSVFGKLITFGQPIEDLVKESKHRRRIVNAAIVVAEEFERYTTELMATPSPSVAAMAMHFNREAERSFQARHRAMYRISGWCLALLAATWLLVIFTPINLTTGIWISLGVPVGGWWAVRHFDPHDHR